MGWEGGGTRPGSTTGCAARGKPVGEALSPAGPMPSTAPAVPEVGQPIQPRLRRLMVTDHASGTRVFTGVLKPLGASS